MSVSQSHNRRLSPVAPMSTRINGLLFLGVVCLMSGCALWQPTNTREKTRNARSQPPVRKEEAVRQFEEQRDRAQYQAAVAQWKDDDFDGCHQTLKKLLERKPDHLPSQLLMVEVELMKSSPREALVHAERAVKSHEEDAAAHHSLAVVLDALGEAEKAKTHYHKAAELAPENADFQLSLDAASQTAHKSSSNAKQLSEVSPRTDERMTERSAERPVRGGSAASAYRVRVTSHTEPLVSSRAFREKRPVISEPSEPSRPLPADDEPNEPAEAEKEVTRPSPVVPIERQMALRDLRREMAAEPDDPMIPGKAALAALQRGEPALAVELAQAGLSEFPDQPTLMRTLGTAYFRLGKYVQAEETLRRAISLDKSSASTYFLLARTLEKLGESESANRYFAFAEKLDPRYAEIRHQ